MYTVKKLHLINKENERKRGKNSMRLKTKHNGELLWSDHKT